MMYKEGYSKIQYGISHAGMAVSSISGAGYPVFSSSPIFFDSYTQAESYLESSVVYALKTNVQPLMSSQTFMQYSISEHVIQVKPSSGNLNMYRVIYDKYKDSDLTVAFNVSVLESCFRDAIREGFHVLYMYRPEEVQELIDNPKYTCIFDKILPMHVRDNIEKFMKTGINHCSDEDKGAIILTSTEEMLELLHFRFK